MTNNLHAKRRLSRAYEPGPAVLIDGHPSPNKPRVEDRSGVDASTIHAKAMQGLRHFGKHGDSTFLARLVIALEVPKARSDLIAWCMRHAGVRWLSGPRKFTGGVPRRGVNFADADRKPFRTLTAAGRKRDVGIDVSILWTIVSPLGPPCRDCGSPSLPGEDTCYRHHIR